MSDLIRRSDAIEAIEGVDWYHQNSRNKDMVNGANSDEHQAWYKAEDVYKEFTEYYEEISLSEFQEYVNNEISKYISEVNQDFTQWRNEHKGEF